MDLDAEGKDVCVLDRQVIANPRAGGTGIWHPGPGAGAEPQTVEMNQQKKGNLDDGVIVPFPACAR